MKSFFSDNKVKQLLLIFLVSRIVLAFFNVHLEYDALYKYWQYLDVETLQHHLLTGVWYDHTQPPVFNLLLGGLLKISGPYSFTVFTVFFKLITIVNFLLLYSLLKKFADRYNIPFWLSLFYLLSPAAMVFENELFYTTFMSMLFLLSCHFLVRINETASWKNCLALSFLLLLICLTRSMYHITWLLVMILVILNRFRKTRAFYKLFLSSAFSLLLLGGWYLKNYQVFGSFSSSSWLGMNFSRNVFHGVEVKDSSHISVIPPFSPVTAYQAFISSDYEKFKGLNDRDLLREYKNDSFRNLKHIAYIDISNQYLADCKTQVRVAPVHYLKNVLQSAITFFAPATRYTVTESISRKIGYYDAVYSFNLSHFAKTMGQRRVALTVSSLPRLLLYLVIFCWLIKEWQRKKRISLLNLFILLTILYSFTLSSLLEHYENMRFRFETEPLFIVVLGQALAFFFSRKQAGKADHSHVKPLA